MKNIINITITVLLFIFSFYYTNKVSDYLKNNDPIMIKIKTIEKRYQIKEKDATIVNNTIIPGISGKKINIDATYQKMKKINTYNEALIVYNEITPTISISNNLDKYIVSGNKNYNNVSILLKVNDLDLLANINNNLDSNINLLLTNTFISNNIDYLKETNYNIVVNNIDNLNNKLDIINYCYVSNTEANNNCSNYNLYTIIPVSINNDYYYTTYQNLENGIILSYNILNEKNINEIKRIINYIKNQGYNIVDLDTLLKE